jgi:hypothetical protein
MRALGASRTSLVPGGVLAGPWVRDGLWRRARAVPSLDLRFADNKSLTDAVTGASLVTFTRDSSGTFVGSDGVLQTAATNVPRFDHDPTTGESLGLLVEESRTNLLLRSEEFDSASWYKLQSSISANATTAPNGTLTAEKLIEDSSINSHQLYSYQGGVTTGEDWTLSVYAKVAERTAFALDVRAIGLGFRSVFNLSTQTATGAAIGSGTLTSTAIQGLGNGWFRCSITGRHPTDTNWNISIRLNSPAGTDSYTGDGTSGIYLWGAQLEAGAFPTSYIPTTTAAATRNADVADIAGSNFSSWYNQTEGTVFASAQRLTNAADFNRLLSFNSGLSSDVWSIYCSGKFDSYKKVGSGADNFLGGADVGTLLNNHRVVAATNTDNLIMATDGILVNPGAYVGMPAVNRLAIGSEYYPAYFNGTIRRLVYWPVRLGNNVLQQVTQ